MHTITYRTFGGYLGLPRQARERPLPVPRRHLPREDQLRKRGKCGDEGSEELEVTCKAPYTAVCKGNPHPVQHRRCERYRLVPDGWRIKPILGSVVLKAKFTILASHSQ